VDALPFEWGTPVDPQKVKEQLRKRHYKIVAVEVSACTTATIL